MYYYNSFRKGGKNIIIKFSFKRKLLTFGIILLIILTQTPLIVGYGLKESEMISLKEKQSSDNDYDLIIISSSWIKKGLAPLVDHKNNHNIKTICVTMRDILRGKYFEVVGRDDAEKVKYFIKSALDEWNIKYVLLAGGRKGGLFQAKWWVPVRYSEVYPWWKESFLCDLYFADIYDSNGNFSSWDSNENGVFSEWNENGKDILDMYPDVIVGRLPFKNRNELETIVGKIINYENNANGSEWFEKCVGVAGDTWPDSDFIFEGELITEAAFSYLNPFEKSYLWTSIGTFTCKQDVINEVNKGCGFLVFSGHADPMTWSTHPPHTDEWIDAPAAFEMDEFTNGEKLPIALIGGCNNAQFDVGILNLLKGVLEDGFRYFIKYPAIPQGYWEYDWGYRCWSWSMATQKNGGCVAIMGNTGLGFEEKGLECLNCYNGYLIQQFFKYYSEGKDILGEVYASQITSYMDSYPPMENKSHCKVVQEWVLLGDPTLKIGGY